MAKRTAPSICAAVGIAPPRGFYGLEADVFMRTAVSFVARSRGHGVPASIVIFLSPTVF
jgi:hypothetical protein